MEAHGRRRAAAPVAWVVATLVVGLVGAWLLGPAVAAATADELAMVRDIGAGSKPGAGYWQSNERWAVAMGHRLYFTGNDADHGEELWRSDGTAAGTSLVADIDPGPGSSTPDGLTAIGDTLYFTADDGSGRKLWRSDGTAAGTAQIPVRDADSGDDATVLEGLTAMGGALYFSARFPRRDDDPSHFSDHDQLWRANGGAATLVKRVSSANVLVLGAAGGELFLSVSDTAHGVELWLSDGSEGGTAMVDEIDPGAASSYPSAPVLLGSTPFFSAEDGVHGTELWQLTAAGPAMVADVNPGKSAGVWAFPDTMMAAWQGAVYFAASDGAGSVPQLWRSDGTVAGTSLVYGGSAGVAVGHDLLAPAPDTLYFFAVNPPGPVSLWRTDGTPAGTSLVKTFSTPYKPLQGATVVGDDVYFVTNGPPGYGLWRSDGTAAGTTLIQASEQTLVDAGGSGGTGVPPVQVDDELFFVSDDDVHGAELWVDRLGGGDTAPGGGDTPPGGGDTPPGGGDTPPGGGDTPPGGGDTAPGGGDTSAGGSDPGASAPGSGAPAQVGRGPVKRHSGRTRAPDTRVLKTVVGAAGVATVRFKATGASGHVTFQCKLDRGRFTACRSPVVYRRLRPGIHRVAVRAASRGRVDPRPASASFTVKRVARARHPARRR
jgi:ELWxxDGT repeat protein